MTPKTLADLLSEIEAMGEAQRIAAIAVVRNRLHELSPTKSQPVDLIRWVPIEQVSPNDYNPNAVAEVEMKLLYHSILQDGYTQPVVTIWDQEAQRYVIVDGFHRYFVCKTNADIRERNKGLLPIVVIEKDINDRMASTVRHNRARGKHSIEGMANMVFSMLDQGWSDEEICNELGMEPGELLRLKHITGFSALFENVEYTKAWKSRTMIREEKRLREEAAARAAAASG